MAGKICKGQSRNPAPRLASASPVDMLTRPGEKLSLAASTLQCKRPKSPVTRGCGPQRFQRAAGQGLGRGGYFLEALLLLFTPAGGLTVQPGPGGKHGGVRASTTRLLGPQAQLCCSSLRPANPCPRPHRGLAHAGTLPLPSPTLSRRAP